ncbi:MAG: MFS transporter [Anaerolineae bacterium]
MRRLLDDPRMLAATYYFAFFAAGGAAFPYYTLFYQHMGMTNPQIGVLAALPTITTVLAAPLWAGVADRFGLHRILLPGLLAGTLLPALLLPTAGSFWALGVLILVFNFFMSPTVPLAENTIITSLGEHRERYGTLRLWGAVGFGISAWGVGFIIERLGMTAIWGVYIVLMLPAIVAAARLHAPQFSVQGAAYLTALRQLAANRQWLRFLAAVFLVGAGYAMYDNFYAIHLQGLGAPTTLLGLIFMVSTLSELPVFFFASRLIRRIGLQGVIVMAFSAFVLRGLAWGLVTDPTWGLAVQLLHGLSFSALWTAGVLYVNAIAPEGLGASAQALFSTVFWGLSRAAGSLLGGQLYETLGSGMFFIAAGVALAGLLVFASGLRRGKTLTADRSEAVSG